MTWQDITIGIGQFIFALALLPSIYSTEKPARWTCFITASLLFLFGGVYFSLELYIATSSVLFCGALWSWLLFQKREPRWNPQPGPQSRFFAGAFRPTHRHAEGGLYELIRTLNVHTGEENGWRGAVLYRDVGGTEYVRTMTNFYERFTAI